MHSIAGGWLAMAGRSARGRGRSHHFDAADQLLVIGRARPRGRHPRGDLLQVDIGLSLDPHLVSDPRHQCDQLGDLVLRKQADLQVEVGPAAAAMRFWLISTKVETGSWRTSAGSPPASPLSSRPSQPSVSGASERPAHEEGSPAQLSLFPALREPACQVSVRVDGRRLRRNQHLGASCNVAVER